MIYWLAGLVLSMMGSIPPGLISLSVSHTTIQRGARAALYLAAGAAFAEFFQAWFAAAMSDWFLAHQEIERPLQWIAMGLFLVLGVYLLFFAGPMTKGAKIKDGRGWKLFGAGVMVSVFNLLAIPYWFTYCGWLRLWGYPMSKTMEMLLFSGGVTIGTMISLSMYVWLAGYLIRNSATFSVYANKIIGVIFLGLTAITLWQIFSK